MRASKLIILSTAAVLAGGANLALAATSMQGSSSLHNGQSIGSQQRGAYGRANPRELGEAGMTGEERTRLRDSVREIPRLAHIGGTDLRIDGIVTRGVRQAAAPLPLEVQHMHPRFSKHRAFKYRDQVVIVNPMTSRIVALIKLPT